jgi:Ser-tRNA(Ala) deacylase AlaX
MTRKLFWENPYQTELTTTITSLMENDLTLAETILYAFSGGQEGDAGTIADRVVRVGDTVSFQLDWARRYALMRLHFAAEIVLELVSRRFPGIQKIGAHIAQDKARIDFLSAESLAPVLPALWADAQAMIAADAAIVSAFSDETAERRYWEIAGFARVACGGTHLRRTGEVGRLELRRKNPGKGKERIEIYVHER